MSVACPVLLDLGGLTHFTSNLFIRFFTDPGLSSLVKDLVTFVLLEPEGRKPLLPVRFLGCLGLHIG